MKSKYKYLSKNVLLFTISGFVPKILSFILIPIYTSYLTTAEYGVSDLIMTTVSLCIPIFTLDIQDAVMRFALDKAYNKEEVFSIAVSIILGGTAIVVLGTIILSFFNIPGLENRYLFFFVLMYFTSATSNTVSLFCRGIDKVGIMVVGSILNSIVTLTANILFLVVFQSGLTGYLIANTIGSTVLLIYCFFGAKLYRYIRWDVSFSVCREMIAFSFPLIFSVIAWWINNASDRYILSWMSGVATSGVFAVAYKIPNLLSMFQNIFAQAWSISAVKEFKKEDSDGFIGNMYTMMNFTMVIICSGIMIIDIPLAKILYSNEFFHAWKFVPPLLISVVFNAMALFIGSIFTAVKDTKTLSVSTLVGACVNIVCNLVFVHLWGAYGAAVATLLGHTVTLAMRHYILRKYICMKIRWWRDIKGYALLLIQMAVAFGGVKAIPYQAIFFCLILMLYRREIEKFKNLVVSKYVCK